MNAVIDYPTIFPCLLFNGFVINHVSPLIRSELASGRARQRRRYTSTPSIISVSWHMDSDVAALFEAWYRDALNDGVEWFNIDIKAPDGTLSRVCRFVDIYSGPKVIGRGDWRFEAELESYDRMVLDGGWGYIPEFWLYRDIFDVAMNCRWPTVVPPTPTNCQAYLPSKPPHGEEI